MNHQHAETLRDLAVEIRTEVDGAKLALKPIRWQAELLKGTKGGAAKSLAQTVANADERIAILERWAATIDAAISALSGGGEDLASWLRWVADELVKRDTQGGTFAQGVAQSLCGRAYILEYVAHKKAATHAQAGEGSNG